MASWALRVAPLLLLAAAAACGPASSTDPPPADTAPSATGSAANSPVADLPPADASSLWTRPGNAADDWPRFLGPAGGGHAPATALPETPLPAASGDDGIQGTQLTFLPLWSVPAGDGHSSPVVADGRLFLFDAEGSDQRLRALRAETGAVLWEQRYPTQYRDYFGGDAGPKGTPAVTRDTVCTLGIAGQLRCHRVTDGEVLWEVDTTARYGVRQNFFGVGASPWIEAPEGGDALVLVPVGGSPPEAGDILRGPPAANGSGLVAFDLATGKERWRVGDELASYSSPVVRTVDGRRLGFAFLRDHLLVFQPPDGTILHRFPWRARNHQSVNAATPVIDGQRVFLTEAYGPGAVVVDFGGEEPRIVWQDPRRDQALATRWITPILHRATPSSPPILYGAHGTGTSTELRAVDFTTGKVYWSHRLGRFTPTRVGDRILLTVEDGRLLLLDPTPSAYRPIADLPLTTPDGHDISTPIWAPPALARGLLFVRGARELVAGELR